MFDVWELMSFQDFTHLEELEVASSRRQKSRAHLKLLESNSTMWAMRTAEIESGNKARVRGKSDGGDSVEV